MTDPALAAGQQRHWEATFAANPDMHGTGPGPGRKGKTIPVALVQSSQDTK